MVLIGGELTHTPTVACSGRPSNDLSHSADDTDETLAMT